MSKVFKKATLTVLAATSLLASTLFTGSQAQAAIQRSADFEEGSTIGIGIYGMSYDYGIGFFSAGLSAQSSASLNFGNPMSQPLKPSLRLLARFYQLEGLSAGVLAGATYDPGFPGSRAYLTPDLGLSVGYDFRVHNAPFALRLNLTLAVGDGRGAYPINDYDALPSGNFFQRLSFGPLTSLELAWMPSEHFEVTLGGGTLMGMRLKF